MSTPIILSTKKLARKPIVIGLAATLVAGMLSLTSCSVDTRPIVIGEAVRKMVEKQPSTVSVLIGDYLKDLEELGEDGGSLSIPVSIPNLMSVGTDEVNIENTQQNPTSLKDLASNLEPLSIAAWKVWVDNHRKNVDWTTFLLDVQLSADKNGEFSASVNKMTFPVALTNTASNNLVRLAQTAEKSIAFIRFAINENSNQFVTAATGLDASAGKYLQVTTIEPKENGIFSINISYPDATSLYTYQAQQAAESYGSSKIWGAIREVDFISKMNHVNLDPLPAEIKMLEKQITVAVSKAERVSDKIYDTSSFKAALASQIGYYNISYQPDPADVTPGADGIRSGIIKEYSKKLAKQIIKAQKRPGTKQLSGATSGVKLVIKSKKGRDDIHIVFYKWGTKKKVLTAFVREGDTLTVRIPAGSYRIVEGSGNKWYGKKYSFGPTGIYTEGTNKLKFRGGMWYTLTLYSTSKGNMPATRTGYPFD